MPKKGAILGDWTVGDFVGSGGNGEVFKATSQDGRSGVIKVLLERLWNDATRYQRFEHEVQAMLRCRDVTGVLPLIDHRVPPVPSRANLPWLVTPLADQLQPALRDKPLEGVVERCLELSETLHPPSPPPSLGPLDLSACRRDLDDLLRQAAAQKQVRDEKHQWTVAQGTRAERRARSCAARSARAARLVR